MIAQHGTQDQKDRYLARMARLHLAAILRADPAIHCADSLAWTPAAGSEP